MNQIIGLVKKLSICRRAVTSVEYGLTIAVVGGVILTLAVSVQSSFAGRNSTKCYTLGSMVIPDKI